MSPAVGLCGARKSAKTAVRISTTRIAPGNQGSSRLRASMTDPRIEVAVQHVHEEVPNEVEGAQHEHAGLHDRIVPRRDRLEDQASDARPGEYRLGDYGPAQELHEEHDGEGDDREQRILQAVFPEHDLLVESLQPGELDVVGSE